MRERSSVFKHAAQRMRLHKQGGSVQQHLGALGTRKTSQARFSFKAATHTLAAEAEQQA
jgi:hypothetical protein